jgi:hypothetical protein
LQSMLPAVGPGCDEGRSRRTGIHPAKLYRGGALKPA